MSLTRISVRHKCAAHSVGGKQLAYWGCSLRLQYLNNLPTDILLAFGHFYSVVCGLHKATNNAIEVAKFSFSSLAWCDPLGVAQVTLALPKNIFKYTYSHLICVKNITLDK